MGKNKSNTRLRDVNLGHLRLATAGLPTSGTHPLYGNIRSRPDEPLSRLGPEYPLDIVLKRAAGDVNGTSCVTVVPYLKVLKIVVFFSIFPSLANRPVCLFLPSSPSLRSANNLFSPPLLLFILIHSSGNLTPYAPFRTHLPLSYSYNLCRSSHLTEPASHAL